MKLKRVLAGVLAVSSVLTFAGCGGGTSSNGGGTTSNKSSATSSKSSATSNATSGNASGGESGTTSGGDSNEWFDSSIKGLKIDESKITEGMKLTVLSNRTDRVAGTGDGYFTDFVKPFEEHYGVTVEITADSDQGAVKQRVTQNLKDCPDVMWIPSMSIKDVTTYFEPLGTVGELANYNDITNKALGDGEAAVVYGVPQGCNANGYVYNKKIWDAAGVTEAPTNVEEFMAALTKIKENTEATPILCAYTDKERWILAQYMNQAPGTVGDPDFKTKLLVNGGDLFVEGEPYYEMLKLMFNIFSTDDIHEAGAAADWQQCKALLANDQVATCMVGSWAVEQFKTGGLQAAADDLGIKVDDLKTKDEYKDKYDETMESLSKITLMPLPYVAPDGQRYSGVGSDNLWGVNNTIDENQKELAKAFIKWWVEKSPYAKDEGFIPVLSTATIDDYPEALKSWSDVRFMSTNQVPGAISETWDAIDKASEILVEQNPGDANDYKCKIAELGLKHGSEDEFKALLKQLNTQWATARDADETLAAFKETEEAKNYIDERFAKKADF